MAVVSVIIAIALVFGMGYAAPYLPGGELLNGGFYQALSIVLAIVISAVLNMPILHMLSGNKLYKKGEYGKACEKYKKAFKTKRLSPDMEIYCGYILLKEGDYKMCEEIFARVEKRKLSERQKLSFETNKALLEWKSGRLDKAIEMLGGVWQQEKSITVAGTLGALMLIAARENGDYRKALEFCEETNEMFTYEKTIMANLGEAYYCTGDNESALRVFGELMDCGTTSPAPLYYYALAFLKAGQRDEAIDMLRQALRRRFSHLATIDRKTVKDKLDEITAE